MKGKRELQLKYYGEEGAGYVRVSIRDQRDGTSLGSQREMVMSSAAGDGVVIRDNNLIEETWTAADPDRPGFRRLREMVSNGEVQHVYIADTDRLHRDPFWTVEFIRHCKDNGVILHFADGTSVETVMDEALQYFKGLFGYQEREKIKERTLRGKVETAKRNGMPNGCGVGFFGTDYDPETKKRTINDAEAAALRLMFDWWFGGGSDWEISRRLNAAAIPTKSGGKWDGRTVRNVMTNEAVTGEQWWGTRRYEKVRGGKRKVTVRPREEWIRIVGFTPQLVEPSVYWAMMEMRKGRVRREKKWNYFLGYVDFVCGECWSAMCGASQESRGKLYPYYRCPGSQGGSEKPIYCSLRSMRADKLEPAVWDRVRKVVKNPEGVVRDLRRDWGTGFRGVNQRISRVKQQIKKCRTELGTLVMQRTKGIIDQEMLERLAGPLNNLLAEHERDLDVLNGQKEMKEGWEELEARVRVAFLRYAQGLESLDLEVRVRLLRLLRVRLVATPGRVLVTGVLDPMLFTTAQTSALPRERTGRSRWV